MLSEKKLYLTKQGLDKIKKKCEELKRVKSLKIGQRYFNRSHLTNNEIKDASFVTDMDYLSSQIIKLEKIIKNIELIKSSTKEKQNIVSLGTTVILEEQSGQVNKFTIVGAIEEADPDKGTISFHSPLAEALLGQKVGDQIGPYSSSNIVYKIKEIHH